MSRSETNSAGAEQETGESTDDNNRLEPVARRDPEWVDDQFYAAGRYDY